jgi:hypothetical protein
MFGLIDGACTPDCLQDGSVRQNTVGVMGEKREQIEFLPREANLFVAADYTASIIVNGQIAKL